MKKCTLCVDRIYNENIPEDERQPACVQACPTRARHFGDLGDPESAISQLVAARDGVALMPELGYAPVNRYLPPRPRRAGGESLASHTPAPAEVVDEASLPPLLRWLDRALSRCVDVGTKVGKVTPALGDCPLNRFPCPECRIMGEETEKEAATMEASKLLMIVVSVPFIVNGSWTGLAKRVHARPLSDWWMEPPPPGLGVEPSWSWPQTSEQSRVMLDGELPPCPISGCPRPGSVADSLWLCPRPSAHLPNLGWPHQDAWRPCHHGLISLSPQRQVLCSLHRV